MKVGKHLRAKVSHGSKPDRAKALRERERRFRLALDGARTGTWDWDVTSGVATWSSGACDLLGLPVAGGPQPIDSLLRLVHPEDSAALDQVLQQTARGEGELSFNFRIIRPDGQVRWLAARGRRSPRPEVRVIGLVYDITDQKLAEAEIRTREERLRLAMRVGHMVTWDLDMAKGKIVYSDNLDQLVGSPEIEPYCSWDTLLETVHPEDRDRLSIRVQQALSGSAPFEEEYRVRMPDGKYRWIHGTGYVAEPSRRLRGISVDIHARKSLETQTTCFARLGRGLSAATTPQAAARYILDAASELCGWDAAYIHIYSAKENRVIPILTIDQWNGGPTEFPAKVESEQLTPLMRLVMETGAKLVNRDDPLGMPLVRFGDISRLSEAMMFVPINSGGAAIGVLSIQSYTPHAYTPDHLKLLHSLANYCGDALQRIQIAEALRQAESRLRLIAENTEDVIFAFDMKRRPIYANPAVERLTGYSFQEIQRCGFINWIYPDDQPRMLAHWEDLYRGIGYSDVEFRLVTKAGGVKWCSSSWGPIIDEAGRQVGVQGRERDITQRRLLERQVLESIASEQRRIGYALHDGLGQVLTGLALKTKTLEEMLTDAPEAAALTSQVLALVNYSIRQTRSLARGLDPVHVEADGLQLALEKLAAESAEMFSISCVFYSEDQLAVPPALALPLFRIAQEAINNGVRHGQAGKIELRLRLDRGQLALSIQNDGQGFRSKPTHGSGMGLHIMQYRANSIGATLTIESPHGGGTRVICRVPLEPLPAVEKPPAVRKDTAAADKFTQSKIKSNA